MGSLFEHAWRSIIKPVKPKGLCLSSFEPREQVISNCRIKRTDFTVTSKKHNKKISGVLYTSADFQTEQIIVYLHGNGGSKFQVRAFLQCMPKYHIAVASFDFPGFGNSDQDYLTYGVDQAQNIKNFIDKIRSLCQIQRVFIWGRSMGALCAIMFAQSYPDYVNGLVLDTPFKNLQVFFQKFITNRYGLPNFLVKPITKLVKDKIVEETKCQLFSIDYLSVFLKVRQDTPTLFIFSQFDGIVTSEEVFEFYNKYGGEKDLCQTSCTHQQERPSQMFNSGVKWIVRIKKKNLNGMIQAKQVKYLNNKKLQQKQKKIPGYFFCC